MQRLIGVVVVLIAGTIFVAAQNSGRNQPNASPSSDQDAGAYGNNPYNSGAQDQPPAPRKWINASLWYLDGQKAEPNPKIPATPQANDGHNLPPSQVDTQPANGAATSFNQPTAADNAALQGHIQQALNTDPALAGSHISVIVTDSAIELSGTVASSKDKLAARRIAQSFDGNRKFEDKTMVTGQSPATQK